MVRRRQLLERLGAEHNRLSTPPERVRDSIADHLSWMRQQLASLDADLHSMLKASPVFRQQQTTKFQDGSDHNNLRGYTRLNACQKTARQLCFSTICHSR